jgi:membrane-bound lytic murein transglycosylase B
MQPISRTVSTLSFATHFVGLAGLLLLACSDSKAPAETAQLILPVSTLTPAPFAVEPTASPIQQWNEPPVAAADPAALAEQIVRAERRIRDATVSGAELAWIGHLQQVVYRRLVEQPHLREPLLAQVPSDVRPLVAANLDAGLSLRALVTPGSALPAWRIVEPAPMDELLGHYRRAEAEFGVPWSYLAAVHLVETFIGRIRGTSNAGAQGPMQFIPSTWAAYGEGDINDTGDAIRAAARYLRANGAPRDMATALHRYNPSHHYVRAVTGCQRPSEATITGRSTSSRGAAMFTCRWATPGSKG